MQTIFYSHLQKKGSGNMKKLISVILASAMTVSIFAANVSAVEYGEEYTNKPTKTYSQKFNDVPTSHWAFSYVGEMTERGVVSGYPNGNFYPDNNATRAEFARIMTSASGLPISTPQTRDFSDVATDAWYAPYIHAAYPYLSGYQIYGGNYYKPDTPALREDIAVALVKLKGYDTLGADESILTTMFTDANSISSEARKYVAVALERGLVSGYEDNTFRGQDSISRAEATAMLWRAYQYGNDNKTFDNITPVQEVTPVPAITPAPESTPTLRPTSTPRPTEEPTPTPAPTLEPTEEPTPTPEPESPYIVDTLADKVNIDDTFMHMTLDSKTLYYYDTDENTVYSLNVESGSKSEVVDVSQIQLAQDDSDETEYYKNFEVTQLYFDETTDKLLLTGKFNNITDSYGLSDKMANYEAILDINNNCIECDEDEVEKSVIVSEWEETGFEIKSGSSMYRFIRYRSVNLESPSTWYYNRLLKYDFNNDEWEILREDEMSGRYIGRNNEKFYVWNTYDGSIIACDLDTKLTDTGINVKNAEVLDFKSLPKPKYDYQRDGALKASQLFITNNDSFVFYDEDNNAIRIIKER